MSIKIALAGNPNCGKTTMFNNLTGAKQYVGNWPGVTVEKKVGKLKGHANVEIVDLPGIYSLSPYTLEEVVTRNFMFDEKPDAIINIIDSSNIERNLYLTTQILELGIPTVIALNMIDVVEKRGDVINLEKISQILGCPVVKTSALKGTGTKEVALKAIEISKNKDSNKFNMNFSNEVKSALDEIKSLIHSSNLNQIDANEQWLAIKLFERDSKLIEKINIPSETMNKIENIVSKCEKEFDDDAEGIITAERYEFIGSIVSKIIKKKDNSKHTLSDNIDKVVTNRILALPIFALIMWGVYYIAVSSLGGILTDWTNDTLFGEIIGENVAAFLEKIGTAPWLQGLINDGIIGGVGAVLGFVPQIMLLFFLLSLLEDCGYMARIAFIMDRIFRKFGLSGKSFIPILVGTGCGVPGIMASRTIENERDRRMTIMTTTFIPCGAKVPFIAMIAGAIFGGSPWVATSAYFIGMASIIVSGIILKKTKLFEGDPAPFVMELPAYHLPTVGNVLRSMWERGWSFIKKAGTIILLSTIVVWFTTYFGFTDDGFRMLAEDEINMSILAKIGSAIAWIFHPLGWGNWQAAVASITGLVAKENIVGTMGILYGGGELPVYGELALQFTKLAGFSFLTFNLLCAPCFAAIGAIKREMNSPKWTWAAIGYQCGFAYVVSLCIYNIGNLIAHGTVNFWTIVAFALVIGFLYLLFRPYKESNTLKVNVKKSAKA